VHTTSSRAEKGHDVTAVRELLSIDEQVTDKPPSDVHISSSSSSQDTHIQEVCTSSMIRQTAGAGRNNEPASAAAECARAADTAFTSGASQSASSSPGDGQFTADAAPRGTSSSSGPAVSAAKVAGNRSADSWSDTAGRQAIDDDDDDDDAHALQHDADTGLMCRHDVITKRHVTNDVSASCGDVTAMADRRRKSPDPFCMDDDDAVSETAEIPDDSVHDELSLQRQNSVLVQLLSAKKLELEDTRQRFKVCTAGLEDEVERLRQEKERLLDRLQLPEDERCSLSVEQQSVNDLSVRLRLCEQHNEQLKNENIELKQDLRDAELAMHELHDQFNADEGVELRQLQKELDNTARDCRLLHFKVLSLTRVTPLQLTTPKGYCMLVCS